MKLLSDAAFRLIEAEIAHLRASQLKDRERIDRLIEALGRKHEVNVSMPLAPRERVPLEPSSGYFDLKKPVITNTQTGGTKQ